MTWPGPSRQPRPQRWDRLRAVSAPDTSAAIYGTITANAVIAASAAQRPPGEILAVTVATMVVNGTFGLAIVALEVVLH